MIGTLLGGIATSPWMRAALRYGAIALAVLLFLLSLRRSGERAGRLAERFETTEKANDVHRRMLEAAARRPRDHHELAERLREGLFVSAERRRCPPVVEYDHEFQARAAEEVVLLPDRSAIAAMLADYSVMRDQARACRER
ncbi:hypothetical protein [Paracoccus aestuarii]|uniref:hypothetical protein n=1 Tax=Paracoccus aestuarii TaxID=453842 RepID=UPI001F0BB5CB|nr:hypothetical protein [Paracoccus aestuarii]